MEHDEVLNRMRLLLFDKRVNKEEIPVGSCAFFVSIDIFAGLRKDASLPFKLKSDWKFYFEGYRVFAVNTEDNEIYFGKRY